MHLHSNITHRKQLPSSHDIRANNLTRETAKVFSLKDLQLFFRVLGLNNI
jgi:hypothetical protein